MANKKRGTLGDLLSQAGLEVAVAKQGGGRLAKQSSEKRVLIQSPKLPRERDRYRKLVLGFDFGTSSFKIIIRDPTLGKAFAIPLRRGEAGLAGYLLPTCFELTSDGSLVRFGGASKVGNPKAALLQAIREQQPDADAVAEAVLCCAAAMRTAREEFARLYGKQYAAHTTRWEVNIGAPVHGGQNAFATETFFRVGAAAFGLGFADDKHSLTMQAARAALSRASVEKFGRFVNVRPEVISEVHGYRNSPQRLEGLHALIDIGATTVDVSTFIIHTRDGEDAFEVLTAEVQPWGVHSLKDNRIDTAISVLGSLRSGVVASDPMLPPREIEKFEGLVGAAIKGADAQVAKRVRSLMVNVLRATKDHRYPKSREWETGVRVFVCGGGKAIPAYYEQIERLIETGVGRAIRLQQQPIPAPDDLEVPEGILPDYDRLAVAYGLSYPQIDFGSVNYPEAIEDVDEPHQVRESRSHEFSKEASAD